MIEQITVNPSNESLFSADFIKGFGCGAKRQFQADVEGIAKAKFGRPTGKWNRLSHDTFHCNLCGHTFIVMQGDDAMNYCPNCGNFNGGEEE